MHVLMMPLHSEGLFMIRCGKEIHRGAVGAQMGLAFPSLCRQVFLQTGKQRPWPCSRLACGLLQVEVAQKP